MACATLYVFVVTVIELYADDGKIRYGTLRNIWYKGDRKSLSSLPDIKRTRTVPEMEMARRWRGLRVESRTGK